MWVVDKPVGFREPFEILLIADGDTIALYRNAIGLQSLEGAAQVLRRHAEKGRQPAFLDRQLELRRQIADSVIRFVSSETVA